MTNSTTTSGNSSLRNYSSSQSRGTDGAPMVVTRLSGWIDFGEREIVAAAWIIPTRTHLRAK